MRSGGPELGRRAIEAVLLGLVSYAGSLLTTMWFLIRPEGMSPFWFVNGIVLAVLLRRQWKEWPALLAAVFVGFAVNSQLSGFKPYPNLVYGLANVIEPLVAAVSIKYSLPRIRLNTLHALRVLISSAVIACCIGATIAWLAGPVRWPLWFIDDLLGMLLVAPTILVFWVPSRRGASLKPQAPGRILEMMLIAIGLTAVTTVVFCRIHSPVAHLLFFSTLPFLLWSALRFKALGAVLSCLLLASLTIGFTIEGVGPFASGVALVADRSLSIQAVMAVLLLSHVALGVALVERDHLAEINQVQIEALELTAAGEPLKKVLDRIVRLVQAHDANMICSILLYDAQRQTLHHGAAPNLPSAFNRAIDGSKVGPCAGSCGAAAALGKQVLISDIATHPNWDDYRHLALPHGLLACWSSPIFSPAHEVLGTFAIYYREARLPEQDEISWVDAATHLASIAILRDRNQQEIRKNEERLRQMFETTHEGVWMLDQNGVTTYVNPRLSDILGAEASALLGKDSIAFVHPEDRELARERISRRMKGVSEQHEIRLLRGDGSIRWVVIAASPITDNGEVVGALGMITDITERKNLQAQIVAAQRMESLGTLAGGIAHDFNNILMGIVGNVGLVKRALPDDERVQTKLAATLTACKRAEDLVRQILTFSRQRKSERSVIVLRPVIEEALRLLRTTLPETIKIHSSYPPDEYGVLADSSQIHQVVMNLGTNAAHAMKERGDSLDVGLEAVTLNESPPGANAQLAPGQYVRLTISDNGTGMDEATLARIFEPFFTTKEPGEGTGLGLSVVLGIVKNHGGAITVWSRVGQGTTFSVYLPVARVAEKAAASADAAEDLSGNGERILYLDNEASLVVIVSTTLESIGYRVIGFSDPAQALDKIRSDPKGFDAIITDHAMPTMSGLSFARAVLRLDQNVPIVLVSGFLNDQVRAEADIIGIREILAKPGLIEDLPRALRRALSS